MTPSLQGVSELDLEPGTFAIRASEWRRDAGQQLQNLTQQHADDDAGGEEMWHLNDVTRADGTHLFEVFEDRRSMEGPMQTSGRRILFRSPDGEPRMAFERDGYAVGAPTTLSDCTTDEVLGSWEAPGWLARFLQSRWQLTDPSGTHLATASREWSLSTAFSTSSSYTLRTTDGTDVGSISMHRDGLFFAMNVTLDRSDVPNELLLAMAYGMFWGISQ